MLTVTCATGADAQPATSAAAVTDPVTGGHGVPLVFAHTTFDLATVGYIQTEFFLEGTAHAYSSATALTSDGKWTVTPSTPAPYKTRIVVDRPINKRKFNGTVVVEWLNVSGGVDASPDWVHMHDELIREGYAWVGVSAQAAGLNALNLPDCPPGSPTAPCGDQARYGSLTHPGDSYSYDIFSQAAQAIRADAQQILGGLHPKRVLGVGESQSAGRLVTYIDAVHPVAHAYDGYLVHSRSAAGAPLSQSPLPSVPTPSPTFIRTDLDVPVLVFTTETDTGSLQARQADTRTYRLWEVAGTAHYDQYGLVLGWVDTGAGGFVRDWFGTMPNPTSQPATGFTCSVPINSGPQTFVLRAAIDGLDKWVRYGIPPRSAPRFQMVSVVPPQFAVDAHGIVLGGIRTPAVDAPVAKLSGLGQSGTSFCFLFGTTVPFTEAQLAAKYQSHAGFAFAWTAASLKAAFSGFVEPEDAFTLWIAGIQSDILR
jgi:hypothetical protein